MVMVNNAYATRIGCSLLGRRIKKSLDFQPIPLEYSSVTQLPFLVCQRKALLKISDPSLSVKERHCVSRQEESLTETDSRA